MYEEGGGGCGGVAFHFEDPLVPSLLTAIAAVSESGEPEEDEEADGGPGTRQKHTPFSEGGGRPPGGALKKKKKQTKKQMK